VRSLQQSKAGADRRRDFEARTLPCRRCYRSIFQAAICPPVSGTRFARERENGGAMESTIVFYIFLGFVFGAMMLALVMGYISTEGKRAQEERDRETQVLTAADRIAAMPRFFPNLNAGPAPDSIFDHGLSAELENYIRSEKAMVNQFVSEPSMDSLYRQAGPSVH
jgi:hypothetical protein